MGPLDQLLGAGTNLTGAQLAAKVDELKAVTPVPVIVCAFGPCKASTRRDVRTADQLPAPADAGWYEVVLGDTVFFACSQLHAQAVAANVQLTPGLRSTQGGIVGEG